MSTPLSKDHLQRIRDRLIVVQGNTPFGGKNCACSSAALATCLYHSGREATYSAPGAVAVNDLLDEIDRLKREIRDLYQGSVPVHD